jgi:2-octaprenylphenol hydroxylase
VSGAARVDVIVVGGGLVGASLAAALGRAGLAVALLEHRPPPPDGAAPGAYDPRVSAVNEASRHVLAHVGAWGHVPAARRTAYTRMHVWAAGGGAVTFDAARLGVAELGHIVENRVLAAALEAAVGEVPAVAWHRPAGVRRLEIHADAARLVLAPDDSTLEAPLVVGADGARSRVRELAGLGVMESPYGHDALVALVRLARPHGDTAWQRFLDQGPVAFLPMPEDHCAVVWSAPPEAIDMLMELPRESFEAELHEAVERRFGGLSLAGERLRFPLVRRHVADYTAPRVALVGDAAHTIHPLAGLGANLGFLDVAALAEVLTGARQRGEDLGDRRVLARYTRRRMGHNRLVEGAMGTLKGAFALQSGPGRAALAAGLGLVDRLPALQQLFAGQAMGRLPGLPGLARRPLTD